MRNKFRSLLPALGWKHRAFIIRRNKYVYLKVVKYRWSPWKPWETYWLTFTRHIKRKPKKHFDGTKNSFIKEWMDITPTWNSGKSTFPTAYFVEYVTKSYPKHFDITFVKQVEMFDYVSIEDQDALLLKFAQLNFANTNIGADWSRISEYKFTKI